MREELNSHKHYSKLSQIIQAPICAARPAPPGPLPSLSPSLPFLQPFPSGSLSTDSHSRVAAGQVSGRRPALPVTWGSSVYLNPSPSFFLPTPQTCASRLLRLATLAPYLLLSLSQSSHSFRCHGSSGIFDLLSIHGGKLLSLGVWCSGRCAFTSGLLSASSLLSPLHYPLMLVLDKCSSSEPPPAHDAFTVPKPRLFHGGSAVQYKKPNKSRRSDNERIRESRVPVPLSSHIRNVALVKFPNFSFLQFPQV